MSSTLRLIGTIGFQRDDGTDVDVDAVPTVKALDLVRLLAAGGQDGARADTLIEHLWPATDDARGRASLRTALAQLRRVLGSDVVRRSGDVLSLGDVDTDIAELRCCADGVEAARRSGADHDVVALVWEAEKTCGGDLVVSRSSCDAVYATRDLLREIRCQMLLDGAAAAARLGWLRDSLELARRADLLNSTEASTRALMVAWAGVGETRRAIESFERLTAHLAEAFGVQPSSQSRALYLQIVTAGDRLVLGPARHHPAATAELADAIRLLRRDPHAGGVVWLHGEPGSGRGLVARQARELIDDAASAGPGSVEVLPEVVDLDDVEAERLRRAASDRGCVLVVPIRSGVRPSRSRREVLVHVRRLKPAEFHDLVCQLLQDRPAPELEARLWKLSGGLAGQVCQTVTRLVQDGALAWAPGSISLAARDCGPRRRADVG